MKVLITGHSGYVGRVLTKLLVENNYEVVGCDTNYFPTTFDDNNYPEILNISPDIRDITIENLKEIDVVVHLAGLSNDPLGELNSQLTHEINYLSTVKLAELSKNAGVKKFIFSWTIFSDFNDFGRIGRTKVRQIISIMALLNF